MSQALRPLTARQKRFVGEYRVDGNARRAAEAAGYSPASAKHLGWQQLQVPGVKAEIEARRKDSADRLAVTAERILDELALVAFARMGDYVRPGPNGEPILDPSALTGEASAALAELDAVLPRGDGAPAAPAMKRVRLRLADKRAALVSLARLLGLCRQDAPAAGPAIEVTVLDPNFVSPAARHR